MKKKLAAFLLLATLCACATIKPPVVIPPEPCLPGVAWTSTGNGEMCTLPGTDCNGNQLPGSVLLRQREAIRQAYEDALRALLHAYGATDGK